MEGRHPLYDAIVRTVAREKSAARCIVTRAVAGCFENGEVASHRVLDLSPNMPLKIEIILPEPELDRILDQVEKMVTDGIVVVEEQDIRVHRTTGGLLPRGLLVRDVMTAPPVSVSTDDDLQQVVSVLVRSEFDGVPVTDKQERLVGMITQDDLVEKVGMHVRPALLAALWRGAELDEASYGELLEGQAGSVGAADIVTRGLPTIGADAPLADAVKSMVKGNSKRLPVLDANGRLVGMLARIDVLRVASAGGSRRRVLESYGGTVAGTTPVSHANLLDVPTVSPDTPARELLDLIDKEGQRVVVRDAGGAPLGVISDRGTCSPCSIPRASTKGVTLPPDL